MKLKVLGTTAAEARRGERSWPSPPAIATARPMPSNQKSSLYAVDSAGGGVNILEANLRQQLDATPPQLETALNIFERLLRRRRTPERTVCTQLLELCVQQAPRRALYVLESMGEQRTLDLDDYCRIVRAFILKQVDGDRLARFEEVAIDMLSFADDAMHNYFAHLSSLLNLELHEQVRPGADLRLLTSGGGGGGGSSSFGEKETSLDVSLISHQRMLNAVAKLCKRGSLATPIVDLLLYGMGGREGAQSEAELKQLASASTGLASNEQLKQADGMLSSRELNSSQRAAASACLQRRLTLVQGPPGTGKTKVAVTVLEMWVRVLGVRPVLACADSNVAVDNIGLALQQLGLFVVRTGRPEAIHPSLHCCMPDQLGGSAAIGNADVVLCTCVGSGAEGSVGKFHFPAVLIDETAQSTEPSCLVPLCHGCRQLALVGDHKQLRPTVVSDEAARQGLQLSLFERLLKAGIEPHLLDTQYRMHPSLADFASSEFYGGRLLSGTKPESRPQVLGFTWPSSTVNVALVPSTDEEEGGQSKQNRGEASTVASIVRSVLNAGQLTGSEIGIVTPYQAQVSLLRQMLAQHPQHAPSRSSQSMAFKEGEGAYRLLGGPCGKRRLSGLCFRRRRLNVLLTRAKRSNCRG